MVLYGKAGSPPAENARNREKLPILIGLFVSNALCAYLAVLKSRHWMGPLYLTKLIVQNPTGVGIVVQVISHILGLILVSALCGKT